MEFMLELTCSKLWTHCYIHNIELNPWLYFQDVDVIITFPHDAKETTVLWYKQKIEKIPGIILRTKTIVTSANKSANCYAFHLSATYKG